MCAVLKFSFAVKRDTVGIASLKDAPKVSIHDNNAAFKFGV